MNRLRRAAQARRERREQYRGSIHYAIAYAATDKERNELIALASQQGVFI